MATDAELIRTDIDAYLTRYEQKELLRFVAVGSVDDGKSTLIGRLLHDTGMVYEDQLAAVKTASKLEGEEIDFSLITDGLQAEREQGITIDVAYRYFSTDARKSIIADTPGHIQYTRNMVTGASTANVGIILIDARLGVLQQSRRHAFIASLLGIPHLAVCVNKMDLTDYDEAGYNAIRAEFTAFAEGLSFRDVTFFPISALKGVNLVTRSPETPWHDGPSVLEYLETVRIAGDHNLEDFRFPVQSTLRPNLDYRGFTGQIVSGTVNVGDTIMTLPSGKTSEIVAIDFAGVPQPSASVPESVCIRLADEIDTSRGDMLVLPNNMPSARRTVDATLVWMSESELDLQKSYILKHTTQSVRVRMDEVRAKVDMDTLEDVPCATLALNEIGRVTLTCTRALFVDPYSKNRATGSFILIDSLTNNTVAAGMIVGQEATQNLEALLLEARAGSALEPKTQVSPRERFDRLGQRGATIWLTGLPGSGRWTLAYALERQLFDEGRTATVIDPTGQDLSGVISACLAATNAGFIAICAYKSYRKAERALVRDRIGDDRVLEVFVNTDEALCRERRPKADFKGFEAPTGSDLTFDLGSGNFKQKLADILQGLEDARQFERPKA